jgi:transcriptional regulator GlxA family with amidase domain
VTVDTLAEVACLSRRQFDRSFVAETGQTPARAIEQMRAEAARLRIEQSQDSLESIARATGFGDAERMRRACLRLFGQPPQPCAGWPGWTKPTAEPVVRRTRVISEGASRRLGGPQ